MLDKLLRQEYNSVMKLSTRAKYGLRLCFLMGVAGDTVPLSQLTKQTNLSEKYLESILAKLKKGKVVGTVRGFSGGYYLLKPAEQITINDILIALDDSFEFSDCVTGLCKDEYCPNKRIFKRIYDDVNVLLSRTTLKDMIDDFSCLK